MKREVNSLSAYVISVDVSLNSLCFFNFFRWQEKFFESLQKYFL